MTLRDEREALRAQLDAERPPTTPGEVLLEEFLKPKGMSRSELSARIGVPIQRVDTLINGKRGVTAETALLLASVFDTSPEFWMNLQNACDLHKARKRMSAVAKPPVRRA